MAVLTIDNFEAGLNTRDSVNLLKPGETPAVTNWTLGERGALNFRNGCTNAVDLPGLAGAQAFIFYSPMLDKWFVWRETGLSAPNAIRLYTRPGDFSGSWTTLFSTGDTGLRPGFVDFPGNPQRLVFCSSKPDATGGPVGTGVHTYDGTTFTSVDGGPPFGHMLALWQNRAWMAGYCAAGSDSGGNPTRLFFSALGDPATWPDANFNDLREKDAAPITALGNAGGALLAFKQRSAYRITDPATGNFAMIDPQVGCVGPRARVPYRGRVYTWGIDGVYEWDGVGAGVPVGDRIKTTVEAVTNHSLPARVVGGVRRNKVVFAIPNTSGSAENDRLAEYDPQTGSFTIHELAASAQNDVSSLTEKGNELYGAVADGDDIFRLFEGAIGADDGVAYSGSYRTPWIQPEQGKLARIERLRVQGSKWIDPDIVLTLRVYKDWDLDTFDSYSLAGLQQGGTNDQQEHVELHSLGHSRSFAFEVVVAPTTASDTGPTTIRSLQLETVPLER